MNRITFAKDEESGDWVVLKLGIEIGLIKKEDDQEFRTFHDAIDTHVDCFDTLEDAMEDISENW